MQEKSTPPHPSLGEGSGITIGIPVDSALKDERTGVEEYTFRLVSQFLTPSRPEGAPSGHYQFILYSSFPEEKVREIFPNAAHIACSPYKRFWSQRVLPKLVAQTKPDIFFSPAYSLPAAIRVPGVVTIHGMEWHNFPEHYSFAQRLALRAQTQKALGRARGIIAVSRHTKKGIEDFAKKIPPVAVIPHGADSPVRISRRPDLRGKEGLTLLAPQKHWRILFVGRKDKRKNLEGMVAALAIVRRIASDIPFSFSAVGPRGNDKSAPHDIPTFSRMLECRDSSSAECLDDFMPEAEKKKYYRSADIFLFPSYDEGFGMPIVEAQAHGVPVVCSSFLKEVAGEGALYCEPEDPKTIASAILTLMLHPEVYKKTAQAARKNVKRFSWEKCAQETLEFLEKACEREDFAF